MAERKVTVTAELDASGVIKGAQQAEKAMAGAATSMQKSAKGVEDSAKAQGSAFSTMAKSARENEQAWTRTGTTLTAFGAASGLALAGAAKAAIDWESAWTGVLKTVDGSAQELDDLNQGLRDMTSILPASHAEIAGVAEAAGQLGIETANVEEFTRTMIDMGETTNLSADEAATAFARFANIMGTSQDDFSNLGSAVVELGNNYATTEREIVEMSLRLAGAGRQSGITEGEVLGLATALSSVGIEAEAGGTAFSRVLIEMGVAVDTGNEKLQTFAEVAGMSTAEFSRAWEEDAGAAIASFVGGLGDIEASGESIQPILEELGMTDIRVGDALRRASSAADIFTGAMDTGNDAYAANIALSEEAALRYGTVAAQLDIARNAVADAAISFGEVLMPAIAGGADAMADFAGWLSDLSDPMQRLVIIAGSAAAGVGLMGGGFLLLLPRILETKDAFGTLISSMPRVQSALDTTRLRSMYAMETGFGRLATSAGAAGIALGTLAVVGNTLQPIWQGLAGGANEAAEGLEAYLKHGDGAEGMSRNMARGLEDLDKQIGRVFNRGTLDNIGEFGEEVGTAFGLFGGTRHDDAVAFFEEIDAGLSQMVADGKGPEAARLLADISAAAERQGVTAGQLADKLPAATAALDGYSKATSEAYQAQLDLATATDAANFPDLAPKITDNARAQAESAEETAAAAEATEALARAYSELLGEIAGGAEGFVSISDALSSTQGKAQEWAQGQADATETADDSWEDFYDGFTVNLDKYLAELQSMVDAQTNWQGNLESLTGRLSRETLRELAKLGPEAAPLVQALVDGTDEQLAEFESNFLAGGAGAAGAWAIGFEGEQAVAEAAGSKLGKGALDKIEEELRSGESTAAQAVLDYNLKAELEILADTDPAAQSVLEEVNAIEMTEAVMDIGANIGGAEETHDEFVFAVDESLGTVRILGNTGPGAQSVADFQADTNEKSATLIIHANTQDIYDDVGNAMHWIRGQRPVMRVGSDNIAFADGGYTGDGAKYDPAGIVHRGEFVLPQETMRKPGMMQFATDVWKNGDVDGAYSRHKLRGYADGGPVAMVPHSPTYSSASSSVATGSSVSIGTVNNNHPVDVESMGRKIAWELA